MNKILFKIFALVLFAGGIIALIYYKAGVSEDEKKEVWERILLRDPVNYGSRDSAWLGVVEDLGMQIDTVAILEHLTLVPETIVPVAMELDSEELFRASSSKSAAIIEPQYRTVYRFVEKKKK